MPKVLDLQALPENVRAMAGKIVEDSCISLLSISVAQLASKDTQKALAGLSPDSCISLLSVSAAKL